MLCIGSPIGLHEYAIGHVMLGASAMSMRTMYDAASRGNKVCETKNHDLD